MTALKLATSDRYTRLLQAATRMARVSSSNSDPDELIRWTVNSICSELGYDYAAVFLLDDTGQWAMLRTAYSSSGPALGVTGSKLAVGGNSMIGLVTRLREPQVVSNLNDEELAFARPAYFPEACSEMAVPLKIGDEMLGALAVQSIQVDAFTQEDQITLQSMADQLSQAIRYSRVSRQHQDLIRRAERRARLLQAANEVGKKVASILSLDELLPKMVDIICEAYGFYYAGVFLIDEKGELAVLRAGRGEAGAAMIAKGHTLAVGGHSMVGMATSLGEARIALDVGEERVHFKNPYLPHTRSEMALPLMVGHKILGAVTVQSVEERAFGSDDILALQTMADHLAVAINNAHLLKELEHANAELLRTKTYEALTASTTKAIHWIGNKTLPVTTAVERLKQDLKSEKFDRESANEDLEMVAESARLIIEVKENLLGQAREHKPRPAMLEDVARVAALQAGVKASSLHIETAAGTPLALADTTQLARALANLFRNSLEASADRIEVKIAPAPANHEVTLSLHDNGQGFGPETAETMWAAFTTTKGSTHTGLGLPAALHVITQLHGSISATSQPGQGATFKILLPAAEAAGEAQPWKGGPLKILLVDDDDAWSRFACASLVQAGKDVTCALTLEGQAGQADLVLVDEGLFGASLEETLTALQAGGWAGKTVVLSPALTVENTTRYVKAGVKDVALKPYTAAGLVEVVS